MYEYKTLAFQEQIVATPNKGIKKFTHTEVQHAALNLEEFNEFICENAIDGWELVTYVPLTSPEHITFVVTFKKTK
jgi:hypothetical protein